MASLRTLLSTGLVGLATAGVVPRAYQVPSDYGFPNPSTSQKVSIAKLAGGMLPNGALPSGLNADSITAWQLIAFNELFETAYFNSLLNNITNNVEGYATPEQDHLVKVFTTVVAQEQSHALGAIAILKNNNAFAPSPCEYMFPVDNVVSAINLAGTFTDVVLGALQGANVAFTGNDKPGAVQLISGVIGQEGEQNGLYRALLNEVGSESPFLTTVAAPFAWSALQNFVVPGSCPFPLSNVNIPILPPIMTNGGPIANVPAQDQTMSFMTDLSSNANAKKYIGGSTSGLYMTYQNGQLLPISVPISNGQWSGSVLTFNAELPYSEYVMGGFSHGALTPGNSYANNNDVAAAALSGPALIQVENPLTS